MILPKLLVYKKLRELPPAPGELHALGSNAAFDSPQLSKAFDSYYRGEWTWEQTLGAGIVILNGAVMKLRISRGDSAEAPANVFVSGRDFEVFQREPPAIPPRPGDLLAIAGHTLNDDVQACFCRWAEGEWTWEQALGSALVILSDQAKELFDLMLDRVNPSSRELKSPAASPPADRSN